MTDQPQTTAPTYAAWLEEMAKLSYSTDAPRWWVWRNGEHAGRECFVAFNQEYPVCPDGGDPLTLGEPVFVGSGSDVHTWRPEADIAFYRARGRDVYQPQMTEYDRRRD